MKKSSKGKYLRKQKRRTKFMGICTVFLVFAIILCSIVVFLLSRTNGEIVIQNADEAISCLDEIGEEYGYENALSELTEQVTITIGGDCYYRLQQNYQGIPVYGRTVVCAIDQEGILASVSGNAMDVVEKISLTPSVTKEKVELSITTYFSEILGIDFVGKQEIAKLTSMDLCIYNLNDVDETLAYCVYSNGYEIIVDAHTAEVLFCRSKIQSLTGYLVSDENHNNGFPVETDETGMYVLSDTLRHLSVYNLDGYSSDQNKNLQDAVPIKSNDLIFGNDTLEESFQDGVLLYQNLARIHDFFYSVLDYQCEWVFGYYNDGRDSGENAFGGKYGNADGKFIGMVSMGKTTGVDDIDVMGHEFTHVMTSENVNWTGSLLENRAIEEAFSDIFGILAEAWYYQISPDWVLSGDNISVERCIFNPKSSNNAIHIGDRSWFVDEDSDEYYHSTIISHTAYLMWNGIDGNTAKRISADELAELWYRSMLMMPSNCNFVECRKLVEWAADSMENLTDDQRLCVSEAFDMVGIASRENAMTAEYHLTKDSTLSVFDEEGNLYAGYTLSIIGEIIDNEPTVNIPGVLRNNRYEKTYQIETAESFVLNLPGGLYTLTVSDEYSSAVYSVTAYVSNEGTDNSIEIFTSYEEPLVVVIPDERTEVTEPSIEETFPAEQNKRITMLTRINRYDENGTLKQETIFNYSANGVLRNAIDRELDQAGSVVHEAVIPFTFDEKGRLTEIGTADSDYYYYDTAGYVYNNGDQLISSFLASGGASGITYEYDNQNRLVRKFEDDYSAPITVETFFYYDDDTKSEIRAKEITTSSWEGERPTVEEKAYVYSFDGNGRVVTICGESDITTYRYEYWPLVIEEHVNSDTGYMHQELNYVDRMGETIWSLYLSSAISEEQTFDDGSLSKLNLNANSGTVTYEFVYDDLESPGTNSKILKYPISEEDCYVIYKNYYGYELPSGEPYQVVVDRFGTAAEETLAFIIYRLNENHGGYTWASAFFVEVNTGICGCDLSDEVFQADDYYY